MNPSLTRLRTQILQCEKFISLCERIKHLEKLQDGPIYIEKVKVEAERVEIVNQLSLISSELQRLEASLNSSECSIDTFEEEQLAELIKSARIRIGSLRLSADDSTKQIERINEEMRNNAQELQDLYVELEEGIRLEGLDPNTIGERLADLCRQRSKLSESIRADISMSLAPDQRREQQSSKQPSAEGAPVHESKFYEGLIADFAQAKSTVEIVSPYLASQRAREIMAELARLAANGRNVIVYTIPPAEQEPDMRSDSQNIIADAHRLLITVIQHSGIQYNAAIIDNVICWEGGISILGTSQSQETMRRTVASSHVRELRHFLFNEVG